MAKSLPESIELNAAVRKEWQLQGELLLSDLDRMPAELIASMDSIVRYEIYFQHSKTVLGQAMIRIETQLQLICQRSLETFEFPIKTENTVGFISEIEDEAKLEADISPSWVEDMLVEPKALIEDEILLQIPDVPLKPGARLNSQYLVDQNGGDETTEETQSPFAALKQLKDEN